ncbi:MAG: hypothetical protein HQK72_07735 [Desulfamplus sp.]|nr:hypothetical protein [Desulfamplus sp.]
MRDCVNIIDLSLLPENARQEVFDFYEFIVQRYRSIQNNTQVSKKKLPDEFYKPIAVKEYLTVAREEIYND